MMRNKKIILVFLFSLLFKNDFGQSVPLPVLKIRDSVSLAYTASHSGYFQLLYGRIPIVFTKKGVIAVKEHKWFLKNKSGSIISDYVHVDGFPFAYAIVSDSFKMRLIKMSSDGNDTVLSTRNYFNGRVVPVDSLSFYFVAYGVKENALYYFEDEKRYKLFSTTKPVNDLIYLSKNEIIVAIGKELFLIRNGKIDKSLLSAPYTIRSLCYYNGHFLYTTKEGVYEYQNSKSRLISKRIADPFLRSSSKELYILAPVKNILYSAEL